MQFCWVWSDNRLQNQLLNCSSGGHDGRWSDIDHTNTWSQFVYDSEKSKLITLDANNIDQLVSF
jgi:hypothetical protein